MMKVKCYVLKKYCLWHVGVQWMSPQGLQERKEVFSSHREGWNWVYAQLKEIQKQQEGGIRVVDVGRKVKKCVTCGAVNSWCDCAHGTIA
jgi:hypothetical protein